MPPLLCPEEYDGTQCPMCLSSALEIDEPGSWTAGTYLVLCCCAECGATWEEVYTLSHYRHLTQGTPAW